MKSDNGPESIWVQSDVVINPVTGVAVYTLTIEVGEDTSYALNDKEAVAWILGISAAAGRAEFDAAVLAQLTGRVGVALEHAVATVQEIRNDRPPLDDLPLPLTFEPLVAAADKRPYLVLRLEGKKLGQWEVDDAKRHVMGVLDALVAADLDAGYFRALRGMGLDKNRCRQIVADVAEHRYQPEATG